jgi:NAD(P)-dependent dehydrogenase (short-subunit alcohol dehydrogenase family)
MSVPASSSTPTPAAVAVSPYAALYADPAGPGDARPTALQIIADLKPDRSLYSNSVVLITGGSSGIGIETARAFATFGAEIYLPVRDRKKAEAIVKDIEATAGVKSGKIHLLDLDLGSLQSVRDCAAAFLAKSNKLNLLINNAGWQQKRPHCADLTPLVSWSSAHHRLTFVACVFVFVLVQASCLHPRAAPWTASNCNSPRIIWLTSC